jgi:hypothetical protein
VDCWPAEQTAYREKTEVDTAFSSSYTTLVALQLVVALVVLTCIVDSVCLVLSWYATSTPYLSGTCIADFGSRLAAHNGKEKLSSVHLAAEASYGPSAGNKLQRHSTQDVAMHASEKRVCDIEGVGFGLEDDEDGNDDEFDKSVM